MKIKSLLIPIVGIPTLATAAISAVSCTQENPNVELKADEGITLSNYNVELNKDYVTQIIIDNEDFIVDTDSLKITVDMFTLKADQYTFNETTNELLVRGKYITSTKVKIEAHKRLKRVLLSAPEFMNPLEGQAYEVEEEGVTKYYDRILIPGFSWANYVEGETLSPVLVDVPTSFNMKAEIWNDTIDAKGNFIVQITLEITDNVWYRPVNFKLNFDYRGKGIYQPDQLPEYSVKFAPSIQAPKKLTNNNVLDIIYEPGTGVSDEYYYYDFTWEGFNMVNVNDELFGDDGENVSLVCLGTDPEHAYEYSQYLGDDVSLSIIDGGTKDDFDVNLDFDEINYGTLINIPYGDYYLSCKAYVNDGVSDLPSGYFWFPITAPKKVFEPDVENRTVEFSAGGTDVYGSFDDQFDFFGILPGTGEGQERPSVIVECYKDDVRHSLPACITVTHDMQPVITADKDWYSYQPEFVFNKDDYTSDQIGDYELYIRIEYKGETLFETVGDSGYKLSITE